MFHQTACVLKKKELLHAINRPSLNDTFGRFFIYCLLRNLPLNINDCYLYRTVISPLNLFISAPACVRACVHLCMLIIKDSNKSLKHKSLITLKRALTFEEWPGREDPSWTILPLKYNSIEKFLKGS